MKVTSSIVLPENIGHVNTLTIKDDGVMVVTSSAELWQVGSNGSARRVPATISGELAKIWDVDAHSADQTIVVASPVGGERILGTLTPGTDELIGRPLGTKEPRQIAKSSAAEPLWFTAMDTSLNLLNGADVITVDAGHYNSVSISPNGRFLAARRVESNEVVVAKAAIPIQWSVYTKARGRLMGVTDDGELLLLEVGLWRINSDPTQSKLNRITSDGDVHKLMEGPYIAGAINAGKLALVRKDSSGLSVEIYKTPNR